MNLWLDIATIIIVIVIMFTMDVELTIVSIIMPSILRIFD